MPILNLKHLNFALELKGDVASDGTFEGYASIFGNEDFYGDIIAKGAFKASLRDWRARKQMPGMLWQHDWAQPIGVWLEMVEDERGLKVRGRLLVEDVRQAAEAYALLKAGAIWGLSIGYQVREDSYDEKTGIRTIKKLDLWEVSLVTFPANQDAQISAVKAALDNDELPTIREFENFLREQGFSRSESEAIASHGLKSLLQGEPGATRGDPEGERLAVIHAALKSIPTP